MSGPGKVAFSDPDALETQVVFTYPGTYELRLIVGDEASLETALLWISVK